MPAVPPLRCPPVAISQVKKGDHFTYIQGYVVVGVNDTNICVRPTRDMKSGSNTTLIDKGVFEKTCWPASLYSRTEKVTRTAMANILQTQTAGRTFQVRFKKKRTCSDLEKTLKLAYERELAANNETTNNPDKGRIAEGLKLLAKKIVNAKTKKARHALLTDTFFNGEERVMVARSLGTTNEQGRINVMDMELVAKNGTEKGAPRLIDPRTIERLVLGGVEYLLKGR